MPARDVVRPVAGPVRRWAIGVRTKTWRAHSRLFVAGDGNDWAIADDARQIARVAARLGADVGRESWVSGVRNQSVFHASQFAFLGQPFERDGNRLGVAYLHGRPGTAGMPEFDTCYEAVRTRHEELERIQVPSIAMEELVLDAGVPVEKVFRIPIGIDRRALPAPDARGTSPDTREAGAAGRRVRRRLVPEGRGRLGRGSRAEAHQGPGRAAGGGRAAAPARTRPLASAHRARARLREAGPRADGGALPTRPACTDRTMSRRRTGRSTSASSRHGTRVGRRPCWRRWRRAYRS